MSISDREFGELIATQKATAAQVRKLEKVVINLHKQQEELFRKMSSGRGFIMGLMIASGGAGAAVASIFSKITGGN